MGHQFPSQQQRAGKVLVNLRVIVQHGQHGAACAVPLFDQIQQAGSGVAVHGVEGLVQQDQIGVLHQQAGKQHPLQLPAGQGAHHALLKPLQRHGVQGRIHPRQLRRAHAAPRAAGGPVAQQHAVLHGDGKAAVQLGQLRQVGHAVAGVQHDLPRYGGQQAHDAFEQRAFAGPVGPDHGGERATRHLRAEVVQRRVLAVADGEVAQRDGGPTHHGAASSCAQATASHSTNIAGSTASTRRRADQASTLERLERGKSGRPGIEEGMIFLQQADVGMRQTVVVGTIMQLYCDIV